MPSYFTNRVKIEKKLLPHYDQRPENTEINTIVIHSLCSTCEGRESDPQECIAELDKHEVAAHYLIDIEGNITQLVEEKNRAWHAGDSKLPKEHGGIENVNDFSIGIELINEKNTKFSEQQYIALSKLCQKIMNENPIKFIVGHEKIALPLGRKEDPGEMFDWAKLKETLNASVTFI